MPGLPPGAGRPTHGTLGAQAPGPRSLVTAGPQGETGAPGGLEGSQGQSLLGAKGSSCTRILSAGHLPPAA